MNKKELQSYIVLKIEAVNNFEPSEKSKAREILEDVLKKYLNFEPEKTDSELKSKLFLACKPIVKEHVEHTIDQLMSGNESFVSENYFQITTTLQGMKDSL